MRKTFLMMVLSVLCLFGMAQNKGDNAVANSIVGEYESVQGGDHFKARITRNDDGTFKGQIFWMEVDRDKDGNKILDDKNPDKSLRKLPADRIVLFDGLCYDADKKVWNGTKIYDPQRGIRAKVTGEFQADGRLVLKGTVLGISEKAYWTKIK